MLGSSTTALNRTTSLPCKPPIKTWTTEEKTLWPVCMWDRTWYFYTSSPVYHRRHGESSNHLLQKTHFLPRSQKGWELQSNYGLAEQSPEFCFIVVLNYAHQRCSLFNEQTNSGQSHQFAVSRFSDALNQVTNLPLYYYFFPYPVVSVWLCFLLSWMFCPLHVFLLKKSDTDMHLSCFVARVFVIGMQCEYSLI